MGNFFLKCSHDFLPPTQNDIAPTNICYQLFVTNGNGCCLNNTFTKLNPFCIASPSIYNISNVIITNEVCTNPNYGSIAITADYGFYTLQIYNCQKL